MSGTSVPGLEARLLERTLELVEVASVSRDEGAILSVLCDEVPTEGLRIVDDVDAAMFLMPERRAGAPFVVLAGHVDTVAPGGDQRARRDVDSVWGRGAADMKGGLAVMIELARWPELRGSSVDLDVGFLFFGREELPITESALLPLFERCPATHEIELAIVMEPTANTIQVGCLGNLNAAVTIHGEAAHTARPWLGRNAIHDAIGALAPIAELEPREVEIEGLIYREVVSLTSIRGGIAGNVVPDRVDALVNFRYAPTRTPEEAEAHLLEILAGSGAEVDVIGNAPPGRVSASDPLVGRLQAAGDLAVEPKQAWTPVAEFATIGVDAVNFGPGDPRYAHRDDERIEGAALVRSYEVLRRFLFGGKQA